MNQQQTVTTAPLWSIAPEDVWAQRAADNGLPLWLRVVCYAEAHALPNGHCPLTPEQLHQALDATMDKAMISRAINRAAEHGWLHPASSARCLVLGRAQVGGPVQECPATHRRGVGVRARG